MRERVHTETSNWSRNVHTKTIDDVLYLNSMLTFAVFIGLSQASPGVRSLENRDECNAGPGLSKLLIVTEVLAFAFFLSSSLSAKALKLILRFHDYDQKSNFIRANIDLKDYMFLLTATSSIAGIIMLLASVVVLIQIQIGLYSCGSRESRAAIWGVCIIVSGSLIMYVTTMSIGIYASIGGDSIPERDFYSAVTINLPQGGRSGDDLV